MLVILLLLALVLLFAAALRYGLDGRQTVVAVALVVGVWVTVVTEALSLFYLLNTAAMATAWLLLVVATGVVIYRQRRAIVFARPKLNVELWLLLAGVAVVAAVTGIIAILAPPNTWDSMTYHMCRVMHWIQNGSVAFYPTMIARQLYQPPWAEWAITHLQLLTGNDLLANSVQWAAWVGGFVTTSLIARELGAKARGQVLTVVVFATLNMGILQSSSTQNDLVVSFWISCVVYLSLYGIQRGFRLPTVIGLGTAVGLSVLTKGITYVYIAPFILWVLVYAWRKQQGEILKYGLALVVIGLALNIAQFSRNLRVFGSPLGGETSFYSNEAMSPALWLSVAMRNVALHVAVQPDLDTRLGFSQRVNEAVAAVHNVLGLAVDDPRVTLVDQHFTASFLMLHEDQTAAPAQLLLTVIAVGLLLVRGRLRQIGMVGLYGLGVGLVFVLFCGMLRWQPWNNRLHLPLFLLLAPFVGVVFERYLHRYLVFGVGVYLLYLAVFPIFFNDSRPLLGSKSVRKADRWTVMFYNRPDLQASYTSVIEQLTQTDCKAVGLALGLDTWEYPLWVQAAEQNAALRFTYVRSVVDLPPEFPTCAVIASKDTAMDFEPSMTVGEQSYTLTWSDSNLALYRAFN